MRVLRKGTATTLLLLVLLAVGGLRASAHTAIRTTVPEMGKTARGTVDRIEITFFAQVRPDAEVEVTGPDGEAVEAAGELSAAPDGLVVRQPIRALTAPGTYRVDVAFTSSDGSPQESAFTFDFEPGSPRSRWRPVLVAAPLVGTALAAVAWLVRRRRTS